MLIGMSLGLNEHRHKIYECKNSMHFFFFSEVEDVVNTTLFLLSDNSSMINGVVLPVDGGYINRSY